MTTIGNPYMSTTGATATGKWIDLDMHKYDGSRDAGVCWEFEDAGNTGTITIEASNDPRCYTDDLNGTTNADFDDISASITSPSIPTLAGAADGFINISNIRFRFVRYKFTYSSGASLHKVYCNVT